MDSNVATSFTDYLSTLTGYAVLLIVLFVLIFIVLFIAICLVKAGAMDDEVIESLFLEKEKDNESKSCTEESRRHKG